MGFITFNETYYKQKLEAFESKRLMEADFACISRLRAILKKEGVEPFVKSFSAALRRCSVL